MTREEIIALIVQKATANGLVPWEFLGGAIAESNLDPLAYRDGVWPDKSPGLFQQTIKYADEGDHTDSPENIAYIKTLYFDPVHACDVAAVKFKYWRYNPDVPALTAWVAYNSPGFYHSPETSPNVENYRAGLAEAQRIMGAISMPKVTYTPSTPAIAQDDDFSCAPTSLRWAMTSLGRKPGATYIEDLLVKDGVVSKDLGLLDASGAQLAAWVGKHGADYYGDDGFYANNEPSVAFDGVALEGDHTYPLLIGGRAWNHWVGVRGYDATRDLLLLANPSDGWMGVGQTMSREQFAALGPFSMVRVLHPDLLAPPVVVPPEPPQLDRAAIAAQLRRIMALHDDYDQSIRAQLLALLEMVGDEAA